MLRILRCVGRAIIRLGARWSGADIVGEMVSEVADGAFAELERDTDAASRRAEMQALLAAQRDELRRQAEEVAREAVDESLRARVADLLMQLPAAARRTMRRPADPTGLTVPGGFRLDRAADLLPMLPTRLPRFRPGQVLSDGRRELVELLGAGGFGEVWLARNPDRPRAEPTAVKFCTDETAVRSLRNEADLLDRLMAERDLPAGIVRLVDCSLRSDPPFVEYEYVGGGDLAGLLTAERAEGRAGPEWATRTMAGLAAAVGFAHRLSPPIVHRDLKPANILIAKRSDGTLLPKVADFGIGGLAADQALKAEATGLTGRGGALASQLRGSHTPLYSSPEQRAGMDPDPRDDVYALGVIWHQLLTGDLGLSTPPGKRGKADLLAKGLSVGLLELLIECLEPDRGDRPADAAVLAERIRELTTAPPVVAAPAVAPTVAATSVATAAVSVANAPPAARTAPLAAPPPMPSLLGGALAHLSPEARKLAADVQQRIQSARGQAASVVHAVTAPPAHAPAPVAVAGTAQNHVDIDLTTAPVPPGLRGRDAPRVPDHAGPRHLKVPEHFPTIQAAVDAARPGDRIMIGIGTFREAVTLRDGVKLVGALPAHTIIAPPDGSPAGIRVEGALDKGVHIENLTVDGSACKPIAGASHPVDVEGIDINRSRAVIKNCHVGNWCGTGIWVRGEGAEAELAGNQVTRCGSTGIVFAVGSKGKAVSNQVTDCSGGLAIYGRDIQVAGSTVRNCERAGIRVDGGEGVLVRDNRCEGCNDGIVVDGATSGGSSRAPQIKANTVTGSKNYGILVQSGSSAVVTDNTADGGRMGIVLMDVGSRPVVRKNTCVRNSGRGISVTAGAGGTLTENSVEMNGESGIFLSGTPISLNVEGNGSRANGSHGILMQDAAEGTLLRNECLTNKLAGITLLGAGTRATVKECRLHANEMSGLVFEDGAAGTAEGNDIAGNGRAGIRLIGKEVKAVLKGNKVAPHPAGDLFLDDGATWTGEGNSFPDPKKGFFKKWFG